MNFSSHSRLTAIITTIQLPTIAVRALAARLRNFEASLIIVGDKKGPSCFDVSGSLFLSLQQQLESPFDLARHWTRL